MCSCDRGLELISLKLDGALSPEEETELQEHLDGCPDCRSLARQLEELHAAMAASPDPEEELPEGLHQRIMAAVREENRRAPSSRQRWSGWRRWASLAAVFAVILAGAELLPAVTRGGSSGGAAPAVVSAGLASAPEGAPAKEDQSGAGAPEEESPSSESTYPESQEKTAGMDSGVLDEGTAQAQTVPAPPAPGDVAGSGENGVTAPAVYAAGREGEGQSSAPAGSQQAESASPGSVQTQMTLDEASPAEQQEESAPAPENALDESVCQERVQVGTMSSGPSEEARAAMTLSVRDWLTARGLELAEGEEMLFSRPAEEELAAAVALENKDGAFSPDRTWKVEAALSQGETAVLLCDSETWAVAGWLSLPAEQ